jgi:hypothetical protein
LLLCFPFYNSGLSSYETELYLLIVVLDRKSRTNLFVGSNGFFRERYPDVMARYPRAWAPWSEAEDADLLSAFESGAKINELAERHDRKPNSIRSRLEKLGRGG